MAKTKSLEDLNSHAQAMITADEGRDKQNAAMDDMNHCVFELPTELETKGIRAVHNMQPSDAIEAATALFSKFTPKWKVYPLAPNEGEWTRVHKIEEVLKWHFNLLNQKGRGIFLWDINHSASLYDTIVLWVDYKPYWIGKRKPTQFEKRSLRQGIFDVRPYHPSFVHFEEDGDDLATVLLAVNHEAREVIRKYKGNPLAKTSALEAEYAKKKDPKIRFILMEMMYHEGDKLRRVVYGDFASTSSVQNVEPQFVLMDEDWPLPFMPWIIKYGGSRLEIDNKYRYHPLLARLHWSGAWTDQCIRESLSLNEAVRRARAPMDVSKTPLGEGVDIDAADGEQIALKLQDEYARLTPYQLDTALMTWVQQGKSDIANTVLATALRTAIQTAGQMPFATFNAIVQYTVSSLTRQKKLAESALEDLGMLMLEWVNFTGQPLMAYRTATIGEKDEMQRGAQIMITPDEFNLDNFYLACELTADTPTDEQIRANMSVFKNRQLNIAMENIHEELGYENSDELIRKWSKEQMWNTQLQLILRAMQTEQEIRTAQAMQAMQAPQAPQAPQATPERQLPGSVSGLPYQNLEGLGFAPPTGGISPQVFSPETTREEITGRTRTGEQLGGV